MGGGANEARRVEAAGPKARGGLVARVTADDLRSRIFLGEVLVPPGMFVPPHRHTHEDETSYVLSGELHFFVGDEHIVAGAGSCVLKPRQVVHSFWNASEAPARMLEIVSPGNLDAYFPALAEIFQSELPQEERALRATELHERYGIHHDVELARTLALRFGIEGAKGP